MADYFSFQDQLARMHAATAREQERSEGKAAYRRFLDYQAGQAVASDIAGSVAFHSRDAQHAAASLRAAARQQSGSVASGELANMAAIYETEAARQRPQQDADQALLILRERIAREHAQRQGLVDRDHYEWHREPER